METIGLFSGIFLFSVLCLLPEVRATSMIEKYINVNIVNISFIIIQLSYTVRIPIFWLADL